VSRRPHVAAGLEHQPDREVEVIDWQRPSVCALRLQNDLERPLVGVYVLLVARLVILVDTVRVLLQEADAEPFIRRNRARVDQQVLDL